MVGKKTRKHNRIKKLSTLEPPTPKLVKSSSRGRPKVSKKLNKPVVETKGIVSKQKTIVAKKGSQKKYKDDLDIFSPDQELDDDLELSHPKTAIKSVIHKDDEDGESSLDDQVALFAGLTDVEDALYDDIEYHEDLDNLHPAELAARFHGDGKGPVGGSDEQILKDLRKLVFSVPLLPQEDVSKLFDQIDSCIFPTVYTILETSLLSLEDLLQIVIKVAAGNTYGKNIYEKDDDHREEEENRDTDCRGTYKDHELRFLTQAYDIIRIYACATSNQKCKLDIKPSMLKCNFIRGVYEDILGDFVNRTKEYESYHWKSIKSKLENDTEGYHRYTNLITLLDTQLRLNKSAFYVAREAKRIYQRYMELRALVIRPYLRSVYSTAKNTARNSHQMLDNFQNGSIGLMRAVSCYSTRRKACFASVAKCWIKQMMLLSIKEDANFVKLPVSTWQAYTQLEKAKTKLGVTDENIASIAKAAKMPLKKAKAVYHTVKIAQVYSLNRTYDQDEKLTLEDIMTNDNKLGGDIDPFLELLRDYCHSANLTDTEIKVLAIRHGMIDLLRPKKVHIYDCVHETLVQNLAKLGYNYRITC